ncbi:MAG: PIN domain-containing protein [Deltaproteobacteria bacterium]|nr:PIN domain-containing protein [Deltaproteobacteria bacterium]
MYLEAMRSDAGRQAFERRFFPLLFNTYLSGVVAEELYAGALDKVALGLVDRYIGTLRRVGRVIVPSFEDWSDAGKLIARMTRKQPHVKAKTQQLLNDILIALCARRLGATVFTFNRDDFNLIRRRHRQFSLEVLTPSAW